MTTRPSPEWLEAFQARFSQMLRTPLDRRSGTLRASPASYDPRLARDAVRGAKLSSPERLAIYNRQYWFRLFTVFHGAFPLTTRLLGHFCFNEYASRFLLAHPPKVWDIDAVVVGFEDFLVLALPSPTVTVDPRGRSVERAAVLQASRIDAAYHHVFRAPACTAFRPSAGDAERLLTSRLQPSPAAAVLEEDWPLCELRRALLGDPAETPAPLPPRLAQPRHWLLVRSSTKIGQLPIEAQEARLLALLGLFPVGEALAQLEQECGPVERDLLPARTQKWLARSVEHGLWVGLSDQ